MYPAKSAYVELKMDECNPLHSSTSRLHLSRFRHCNRPTNRAKSVYVELENGQVYVPGVRSLALATKQKAQGRPQRNVKFLYEWLAATPGLMMKAGLCNLFRFSAQLGPFGPFQCHCACTSPCLSSHEKYPSKTEPSTVMKLSQKGKDVCVLRCSAPGLTCN